MAEGGAAPANSGSSGKAEGEPEAAETPRKLKPEVIPPEAEEALKKVVDEGGSSALLSIFGQFSRTTVGPDPDTALSCRA